MAWVPFGHRGKGGRNIDYVQNDPNSPRAGEIITYHEYLKNYKYGGLDPKQFAKLRKDGRGKRLTESYKAANKSYDGLKEKIDALRASKPGHERRTALIPFYPNAAYQPDYLYDDDDTGDDVDDDRLLA